MSLFLAFAVKAERSQNADLNFWRKTFETFETFISTTVTIFYNVDKLYNIH